MGRRGHTDVARRADLEIELVVRPDGEELPAMALIFRQVVVDDDRLRRVVEVVLDLFDLRNSGDSAMYSTPSLKARPFGRYSPE
jgi:hypothetical protein